MKGDLTATAWNQRDQHDLRGVPDTRRPELSENANARPSQKSGTFLRPFTLMHVTETWTGGVGTYLESILQQQLEDPSISAVHLACSASRTPERLPLEGHPKLHVHRYESSRSLFGALRARKAIRELVRSQRPDLLHLHSTFAGVYGRTFQTDVPIVYCAHGWAFTQELSWPVSAAYSMVEALLSKQSNAIIHISQGEFDAAWKRGVRAALNPVILSSVRPPRVSLIPPIAVDPNKINLAFVGRFDRQKGAELLLDALSKVRRDDIHLYLLGDFDRDREGGELLEKLNDRRVTRLGWIANEEIDDYIARVDGLVIPSRWEGFGLVATEAMRNGKAVLVSNRGGLPEQVIDGFNGYVFALEEPDELTKLLERLTKSELTKLGANAKQVWRSSFNEQRTYRSLHQLYRRVMLGDDVGDAAP
ncbi:MAG: hypothetical protein RL701_8058 [Pseudomonadota bacterium]